MKSWLIGGACTLVLAQVFLGRSELSFVAISMVAVYVAASARSVRLNAEHLFMIACFALMLAFAVLSAPEYAYRPIYYIALAASCYVIGNHYASNIASAVQMSRALLVSYFVALLALAAVKGFSPADINTFLPHASRNYVSGVALFLQLFYSIAVWAERGSLPKLTPLVTVAISIFCYGRTGIALSSAVAAISYAQVFIRRPLLWSFMAVAIAVPVVSSFGAPELLASTNFNRGLSSPQRAAMLSEYLEHIDGFRVISGGHLSEVRAIRDHGPNLNPHNSYIRGHAFFGFPHTLAVVMWIMLTATAAVVKGRLLPLGLFLVYPLRAVFDSFALFGLFDFVFFFGMLAIINKPSRLPRPSASKHSHPAPATDSHQVESRPSVVA